MAPTNPAEQAKQSLDSTIKRFLLEQCSGGSRKEVSKVVEARSQHEPQADPIGKRRSFKKATTYGTIWAWSRRT
jgi:hypothetical protein